MTESKTFVLDTMRRYGETQARELQSRAGAMTGTELYAEEGNKPL